ncbi:hypothetical protein LWC34_33430 [Kibdelosporangium philippinense]|uniref:DUF1877 domain-containing protein n=1 Tax=Kibdelosporangium philippinense TaxID=211113 RepID=A0ABS8ZIQ6_9PSEU|nr:hypothetical protein [Kibdelosporangium philippinense]MCE7007688.1 hypothetical protein [Kibdelosporangium philippinense]
MGLLTDYFSAASDEQAAAALFASGGPLHADPPFKTVEAKGIEPSVTLARLAVVLTGEDIDTVTAAPDWTREVADDEDKFVGAVPDSLKEALAQADDAQIPEIAREWATAEEFFGHADPEFLAELVRELVDLARHATEQGERLYVWVCL